MSGLNLTTQDTAPLAREAKAAGRHGESHRDHPCDTDANKIAGSEQSLWMPPNRLYRYQGYKLVGGLMMSGIFFGWLILQGSNPVMWWLCVTLIATTLWVVLASIITDTHRARDRQIRIVDSVMRVTTTQGAVQVHLDDVAWALWRDGVNPGLWLHNHEGRPMIHLDLDCLANQAEARVFLNWARQRADLHFEVYWPTTPG